MAVVSHEFLDNLFPVSLINQRPESFIEYIRGDHFLYK